MFNQAGGGAITQNVASSLTNNSTTNLAAGATFTGIGESTLGVAGIQVNFISDQRCTIYVDQSLDNLNWDITDTFNYITPTIGWSTTVQATANYYRVRITNNGAIATTYFRLGVALCPIVEALPRALDSNNHLQTTVHGLKGLHLSYETIIDTHSALKTATMTRLIGTTFASDSTIDSNFWTAELLNGGQATQSLNVLTLRTNSTANASASMFTVRTARYIPGAPNEWLGTVRLPDTGSTNNVRMWGAGFWDSGLYFTLSGSQFGIGARKSGVDTTVVNGNFNGEYGTHFTQGTNYNRYSIMYTNSTAIFFVNNSVLHTLSMTDTPLTSNIHLRCGAANMNFNGGTADTELIIRNLSISRYGDYITAPTYGRITTAATNVFKRGPGTLHKLVINTPQGTGTIVIYDNTTNAGTIIASLDVAAGASPATLLYDVPFNNGLTCVNTGTWDVTVVYD